MINKNIIEEFEKLILCIQNNIDNETNPKKRTADTFRVIQIKKGLNIIKAFPDEITLDNIDKIEKKSGIGKGISSRIQEVVETGKLKELEKCDNIINVNKEALDDLMSVVGIGRITALEYIKQGIKSVQELKDKIDKNEIDVNDKILLGIKYYGKFKDDIPRKEIDKVYKLLTFIFKKLNKIYKLDEDNEYIFEICGSYRRGKDISGDIDILFTKKTIDKNENINHLDILIQLLKTNIKKNNDKPFIVDDITDKNYETKYMGFSQYKDNPIRRLDVRFIPYESYFSGLLYFTGPAELNKNMRVIAKNLGYKLSEYGLIKNNKNEKILSESDIFKLLKLEYLDPTKR